MKTFRQFLENKETDLTFGNKLKHHATIKTNFPDADFWIVRRGTPDKVGSVTTEFNPEHIGVQNRNHNILPDYLKYALMHTHQKGYYRGLHRGVINLQHITSKHVEDIPIDTGKSSVLHNHKLGKSLVESLHKSFISKYGSMKGMQVEIHKNPSQSSLHKHASYHEEHKGRRTGNKESGIWLHNDDMYAFDRYGVLHGETAEHVGQTGDHLPIYLYHNGKNAHAMVTDASRNTKWHHNPETYDYIVNHPQLKRHFNNIDVSYYDEDINGAWHHKNINEEKEDEWEPHHTYSGYHGTPDARGIHKEGFRTLRQRHTGKDDLSVYFGTSDYKTAKSYANPHRAFDYQNSEPAVLPVEFRMKNPKVIHWGGNKYHFQDKDENWHHINHHIEQARKDGYDGFIIHRVIDNYNASGKPSTVMGVFDNKNIRVKK